MSYTLTIDSPEKAAWFEQRKDRISPSRLGSLFVAYLMQQEERVFAEETPCRNPELLALAGTWVEDPDMERALADMDKIDGDMWK